MSTTPIDLYRQGNSSSPRIDNVRPNKDVATYTEQGETWVMPTIDEGQLPDNISRPGGISTFAYPGRGKNWWKLDAGTEIPSEIKLVNDRNGHWLWQPSRTMTMDAYKAALRQISPFFYKVR